MSRCVETETYSPAAIDSAPATSPATPAVRMTTGRSWRRRHPPPGRPWTRCRRWRRALPPAASSCDWRGRSCAARRRAWRTVDGLGGAGRVGRDHGGRRRRSRWYALALPWTAQASTRPSPASLRKNRVAPSGRPPVEPGGPARAAAGDERSLVGATRGRPPAASEVVPRCRPDRPGVVVLVGPARPARGTDELPQGRPRGVRRRDRRAQPPVPGDRGAHPPLLGLRRHVRGERRGAR